MFVVSLIVFACCMFWVVIVLFVVVIPLVVFVVAVYIGAGDYCVSYCFCLLAHSLLLCPLRVLFVLHFCVVVFLLWLLLFWF